jgi:hypothetical protein
VRRPVRFRCHQLSPRLIAARPPPPPPIFGGLSVGNRPARREWRRRPWRSGCERDSAQVHPELWWHEMMKFCRPVSTAAPHAAAVPSSKYVEVVEFVEVRVLVFREPLEKMGRTTQRVRRLRSCQHCLKRGRNILGVLQSCRCCYCQSLLSLARQRHVRSRWKCSRGPGRHMLEAVLPT